MRTHDVIIIGAGAAGMSCALSAYQEGIKDILVIDKEESVGGILQQCIHTGFGLHTFNEELSGPEYAQRCYELIKDTTIQIQCNTMVLSISKEKIITCSSAEHGLEQIQGKAIVCALGSRERSGGAIALAGTRPSGVLNAGCAQRYLNIDGYMCGKRVFILGSGDIGLIMARRMSLEGAKVVGVAEIMPYSNGLPRNIKQCLEDFDIPLYLSHTVTRIDGKERVCGIEISKVDDNQQIIKGSQQYFDVDTLLLSIGLIPENTLLEEAGALLHDGYRGAIVDDDCMTSLEGVFACGNALHIHDLVDYVFEEGKRAGKGVARYLQQKVDTSKCISVYAKGNVSYVVPQKIHQRDTTLLFRVRTPMKACEIVLHSQGKEIKRIRKLALNPSEMQEVKISSLWLKECDGELVVEVVAC